LNIHIYFAMITLTTEEIKMKTEKTYRTFRIITYKVKSGYESYAFKKGEVKSFLSQARKLKRDAIDMIEIIIDGKIQDGYLSEAK